MTNAVAKAVNDARRITQELAAKGEETTPRDVLFELHRAIEADDGAADRDAMLTIVGGALNYIALDASLSRPSSGSGLTL
jgi:hypothetical protein